ncbi:MAG TPA: hypothetical protein VFO74_06305, partial [Pseudolabrys sp.]|nr:hypothetical protein [Pseudolabrys sp.]
MIATIRFRSLVFTRACRFDAEVAQLRGSVPKCVAKVAQRRRPAAALADACGNPMFPVHRFAPL